MDDYVGKTVNVCSQNKESPQCTEELRRPRRQQHFPMVFVHIVLSVRERKLKIMSPTLPDC